MWIWVVSNIAGSLLGAASTAWIKDTKVGVWGYSKFEDIADWAKNRYGIDILDKEDIAWKTKYPNVAKKIEDLEQRLHKIEVEEERHRGDGKQSQIKNLSKILTEYK